MVLASFLRRYQSPAVRRLGRNLDSNALNRQVYNNLRQGASVTQMVKDIRAAGVSVTPKTLHAHLLGQYGVATLARYDRKLEGLGRRYSLMDSASLGRLYGQRQIRVGVRVRLNNGKVLDFNEIVTFDPGIDLTEITEEVRRKYQARRKTKGSKINEVEIRGVYDV